MLLNRGQLRRLREIGAVLVKHGWGQVIVRLELAGLFHYRGGGVDASEIPTRLLLTLEELGPTFIKLGQILSTRPDIMPAQYIEELSKLQDTAPTIPTDQVKEVIRDEYGKSVEDLYLKFNNRPLAAASLGQVHTARLKEDGSKVIVKVQRPNIRNTIDEDISILYYLARFLESRWERAKIYGLTDIVDEFAITIREELDYTHEAHNTEKLGVVLSDQKCVRVPKVIWEYTTSKVLTLEWIDGVKITDLKGIERIGADRKKLANRLASVFIDQIFVDGYFHADPHPGNILVTPDHQLALIDAGQVRSLDSASRAGIVRLLIAFENQDTRQFAEEIMILGISSGEVDVSSLTRDLEKVLRQYYDLPARSVNLGRLLMRVMDVSAKRRIRLPSGFAVIGKVLANIDGINRLLDPDYNFTEIAKPFVLKAVRKQLNKDELLTDTYRSLIDTKDFLLNLPQNLNQLIRKAVEGSIQVDFKHRGLDEVGVRLDRISNRLAFAVIVGSLIIGSSLLIVSHQGPRGILGLPLLGLIGYLVAAIMGIWLLSSIIRSGQL